MKLLERSIEHCPGLEKHPELRAIRPHPIGIAGSAVYRFKGTNVYTWYVNKRPAYWDQFGDLIYLTPSQVKKFKNEI